MTLQEHRNQLAAARAQASIHDSFPAQKAKLRKAMFAAFEQALSMTEWAEDDDRMLDLLGVWLVSVYERIPGAAPAPPPPSPFGALDLKRGENLVPESWKKS